MTADPLAFATAKRVAELKNNLATVEDRIRRYTPTSASTPRLIVVTKFFPASDVRALATLGVRDVGENKEQEASAKHVELADLQELRWHFIGQLQRNKAKPVAKFAHSVHSVDRESLAEALSRAVTAESERREREGAQPRPALESFIQLDLRESALSGATESATSGARGGVAPARLLTLANTIAELPGLRLAGVMAVAPLGEDPNRAFERLHRLSHTLQREHRDATSISAGMSQDMQAAIENGATHLRIGSDILGSRLPVR